MIHNLEVLNGTARIMTAVKTERGPGVVGHIIDDETALVVLEDRSAVIAVPAMGIELESLS